MAADNDLRLLSHCDRWIALEIVCKKSAKWCNKCEATIGVKHIQKLPKSFRICCPYKIVNFCDFIGQGTHCFVGDGKADLISDCPKIICRCSKFPCSYFGAINTF